MTDRATAWLARGMPKSSASLLNGEDITTWNAWSKNAVKFGQEPPPSDLQKEYIRVSAAHSKRRRHIAMGVGTVLLSLVLAGAVAAGLMAGVASSQRNRAEASEVVAKSKAEEAIMNYKLAEEANQAFSFALVQLILSSLKSQLGSDKLRASEFKVLDSALDIIKGTEREAAVVGHLQSRLSTTKWIQQTPLNGRTPLRVEWSPLDPNVLLTSTDIDSALLLWDLQSANFKELRGHIGGVWDHSYSPDGNRVISVGKDGTARIWDMVTLQEIETIEVFFACPLPVS